MVLNSKRWADGLTISSAIISGLVGVEGLVSVFSEEEPSLGLRIVATLLSFIALVLLSINNTWKPTETGSSALSSQVKLLSIQRGLTLQLALRPSERNQGEDYMRAVLDDYEGTLLSAPTKYKSIVKEAEKRYNTTFDETVSAVAPRASATWSFGRSNLGSSVRRRRSPPDEEEEYMASPTSLRDELQYACRSRRSEACVIAGGDVWGARQYRPIGDESSPRRADVAPLRHSWSVSDLSARVRARSRSLTEIDRAREEDRSRSDTELTEIDRAREEDHSRSDTELTEIDRARSGERSNARGRAPERTYDYARASERAGARYMLAAHAPSPEVGAEQLSTHGAGLSDAGIAMLLNSISEGALMGSLNED